jgi:hypothetical protein
LALPLRENPRRLKGRRIFFFFRHPFDIFRIPPYPQVPFTENQAAHPPCAIWFLCFAAKGMQGTVRGYFGNHRIFQPNYFSFFFAKKTVDLTPKGKVYDAYK